ncbi:MAG: twin-arginine translocase subunit TatC, partial [Verrucomicrobiia bacterium]
MTEPHHDSVDPQEEPDDELSLREKPMGFLDHLEELRWVLMKSAIAFTICAVGIGIFLKKFNIMLMWPLFKVAEDYPDMDMDLGTTSVMESFTVVIQMCVVGGLIMAAPFI